jgi:hypothetical protein
MIAGTDLPDPKALACAAPPRVPRLQAYNQHGIAAAVSRFILSAAAMAVLTAAQHSPNINRGV